MVQARTRIMNQLQAVALNEGLRCKKRLWRDAGRDQLESFALAPWASRRRRDFLELLDRLTPTIAELTQAIEQEVEKCPAAQRLQTHPGVGALTALSFVLGEFEVVIMIAVVTEEMHGSDCVKKRRKAHAVQKMTVGPSESSCRRGLQTAMSCFSQKLRWWTSWLKGVT